MQVHVAAYRLKVEPAHTRIPSPAEVLCLLALGILGCASQQNMNMPNPSPLAPSITSLSVTSGPMSTPVTITGANFGATQGTSTVNFNGTLATPTSWSGTSIVSPVPTGATTGNVVVTVGGVASNGVVFTVTSPTQTPTRVQLGSNAHTDFSRAVGTWKSDFPNPTKAGNAIIAVVSWGSTTPGVCSVADDKTNSYTAGPEIIGTGAALKVFFALNVAANTVRVTMNCSPATGNALLVPFEYTNIATSSALDVSTSAEVSGTSYAAGSITTTVDGDLIFQTTLLTSFTLPSTPITWTKGTNFSLAWADDTQMGAAQEHVQATHGGINPTMTSSLSVTDGLTIALAFKKAAAGSNFTGIHVNAHVVQNPQQFLQSITATSFTYQFPAFGNAILVDWHGATAEEPTGMTTNHSGTLTASLNPARGAGGIGDERYWYLCNATTGQDLTITITFPSTPGNHMLAFIDISNADSTNSTSCYDNSQQATATFSASSGTFSGVSITPATSGGVVLSAIQENSESAHDVSPGAFVGENIDVYCSFNCDEDGGWAVYNTLNTSQLTFNWTFAAIEGGTPNVGNWANQAIAIKAPAGGPPQ